MELLSLIMIRFMMGVSRGFVLMGSQTGTVWPITPFICTTLGQGPRRVPLIVETPIRSYDLSYPLSAL